MADNRWTWAKLTDDQLELVAEAEQTLDMDYLLAYQPSQEPPGQTVGPQELEVAPLTESQLECLQGLETKLQAVVVGYRKRKPSG